VNIVRRKVAEGMKLPQIAELLCQHCLAPDTTAGAGTGCDNMTALIVAVLNGKTEDEWYKWVAERVQREHGFPTPAEIPQLYSASRIQAFQARQRAREEARRDTQGPASGGNGGAPESGGLSSVLSGPLGGFARVLGSAGGISFNPGAGIISDTGTLMFDKYDSESDEDEGGPEDTDGGASFFGNSFGAGPDSLHAQIADLEKDEEMGGPPAEGHGALAGATQGEAPPPPAPHTAGGSAPQKQLSSQPAGGEVPAPAVAADGLMDKSEDPLKST
jgi:protein phosphatase 2C family protein 2/3